MLMPWHHSMTTKLKKKHHDKTNVSELEYFATMSFLYTMRLFLFGWIESPYSDHNDNLWKSRQIAYVLSLFLSVLLSVLVRRLAVPSRSPVAGLRVSRVPGSSGSRQKTILPTILSSIPILHSKACLCGDYDCRAHFVGPSPYLFLPLFPLPLASPCPTNLSPESHWRLWARPRRRRGRGDGRRCLAFPFLAPICVWLGLGVSLTFSFFVGVRNSAGPRLGQCTMTMLSLSWRLPRIFISFAVMSSVTHLGPCLNRFTPTPRLSSLHLIAYLLVHDLLCCRCDPPSM